MQALSAEERIASLEAAATATPAAYAQATAQAAEQAADPATDAASNRTPTAQHVVAATTALLEQVPTDMAEPDRLASLCELLCAAEVDEMHQQDAARLDPAVATAVEQALTTFVRSVQSAAANGSLQVHNGQTSDKKQECCSFVT